MDSAGTDLAPGAGIIDIFRDENGIVVSGAEGLELLEYPEELRGNLGEVYLGVSLNHRGEHLACYLARDETIHP